MIKYLRNKFALLDVHTKEVVIKSSASTLVKVFGMLFSVLVSVFLGRTLGADGLGVINLATVLSSNILVLCLFGMPQVIIKEVAIGFSIKDWKHTGSVMSSSYLFNGTLTFLIALILCFLTPWISNSIFKESRLIIPLYISFIALIPQVFTRIFSSGLAGYRKIWQSSLADQTLSFFVIALLLFLSKLFNIEITINNVAIIYALGRSSVMITLGLYWKSINKNTEKVNIIINKLFRTSFPLLLVTYASIIVSTVGTIILGWLGDTQMVGIFSVATRIATLTSFFLLITNSSLSPKIAALFSNNKTKEMEKTVQQVTLGLIIIGVFSFIFFIVFGKSILSIWGSDFIKGYSILLILSIGQFINIATGASGLVLMMCGYEKTHRNISLVSLIISLLLNYILIKYYGIMGAAIASAIVLALENIIKVIYAKRKVGVLTIPVFNVRKAILIKK